LTSREELLREPVVDITLEELKEAGQAASRIIRMYEQMGGFRSRYIAEAARIIRVMRRDKACTVFLAFTANLVATGLRGLLAAIIRSGWIDAIVTTGGAADHDIARGCGARYYKGLFEMDDSMLRELRIHRLGNILIPFENYGPVIEEFTHRMLSELTREKQRWTPSELLREAGKRLSDPSSILAAAASCDVPVFSPGIVDSAFGTAIYTFNEAGRLGGHRIELDVLGDMARLSDMVFDSERLGAIIIGGGISKHHVIWWAQFKGGLDYAIYISTAVETDGSLSGAQTREAISWGKIKRGASHVNVPEDATVAMPILAPIMVEEP